MKRVFERARLSISEMAFRSARGPQHITISGGVVRFPDEVSDLVPPEGKYMTDEQRERVARRLFEIANARLRCAKETGKNQIHYEDLC